MSKKYPDRVPVVEVTPEMAKGWLAERYDSERNIRPTAVNAMTRDMVEGTWQFIADAIRFDGDGRLIDGQHRLSAIIASGKAQPFVVVNLPKEARVAIDIGNIRSLGDVLGIGGHVHGRTMAAIARKLLIYRDGQGGTGGGGGNFRPSRAEEYAFVVGNKEELLEAVDVAMEVARIRLPMAPSAIGAAYYLCKRVDADLAKDLFHKLASGVGLVEGDPVAALRNRAVRTLANSGRTMLPEDAFRFTIMAWNATRSGNRLTRLNSPRGGWNNRNVPQVQ